MAIEIEITMNPKIRKDLAVVSKQSADDTINLIFSDGSVTLLGYSSSSFCLCKEFIDCSEHYNLRVKSGIVLAMYSYAFIRFNITIDKVTIYGLDKDKKVKRSAQIKVSNDTAANYQADFYNGIIRSLRAGLNCNNLTTLKQFYKISKVNPKSERGVVISNNQFYTCGDGFKFYSKTDIDFNCFILSDDLMSLIEFTGESSCILYNNGGYVIAKNENDCYFGVRISNAQEGIRDLESILRQKPMLSFKVPIQEVKSSIKSIKDDKSGLGKISFNVKNKNMVVGLRDVVFAMPIEYQDSSGDIDTVVEINFKLFNKLIQTLEVGSISSVMVYSRFIILTSGNESILIIGRS